MGCVASRIDKEERVQVCKQRKRLMKKLVGYRGEFADAQLAYLRALKNTGVTLRQFTESELLKPENTSYSLTLPPSPPPPLPPSPPPPPFSPDLRKANETKIEEVAKEEIIEINQDDCCTPPPVLSSSWDFWDPFGSSSPHHHQEKSETVEPIGEENWAETKTEFEEDDRGEEVIENIDVSALPEKLQRGKVVDGNSSMTSSWYAKETADMPMVVWRRKITLEGIVKKLDDYFLRASAGGKEIAVLMDINPGDNSFPWNYKEHKRKRSSSTKVFSALSWSRSSKSLQFTRDAVARGSSEPCRPGAHCITLDRLYAAEQKLYKEVKEEEISKLEYERKSKLLQKQEEENHDWTKTEKTRSSVESLEMDISRLQQSISSTCSTILELIDQELYPQLIMLISGLMQMWGTMYECHRSQNHIAEKLHNLSDNQDMDLSTEFHRQATAQLETEIVCWYNSFCRLVKSQQVYATTLRRWIELTDSLVDNQQQNGCSSAVCRLCEGWQIGSERLPDKVASEAIKSFLLAIQSIIQQQAEELNQQKKSDKLEKRLQKELAELQRKAEGSFAVEDLNPNLSPKHPLSQRCVKTEALKKLVDAEKAKYVDSIQVSKTMTLNNLKTSLPNVFQALMRFSSASAEAFEAIQGHVKPELNCSASEDSAC
ncbi:hypothetical protein SLA2020_374510 [Shorea laevis]